MFFSRWFGMRPSKAIRRKHSFRPSICLLEDRITPSGLSHGGHGNGFFERAAVRLQVLAPEHVDAGQTFTVEVDALAAKHRLAKDYTGTVHFTLSTPDGGATVPADYLFTPADHGRHRFQFSLDAVGHEKIRATDTAISSITGSATTNVEGAPIVAQLAVLTQDNATVGVPAEVTVVAVDSSGDKVPSYTGTVLLTSSDSAATLPAKYTFTAADHGRHTFLVTLNTPGAQTVTATDTATASITGKGSINVNAAGVVTHFGIITDDHAVANSPTGVKVVALDAANQVVAGYLGTVHFTSSDADAILPPDYTFVAADHGAHEFAVTLAATGKQTITATDTANKQLTGQTEIHVAAQQPDDDLLANNQDDDRHGGDNGNRGDGGGGGGKGGHVYY